MSEHAAIGTARSGTAALHVNLEKRVAVVDAEHVHIGKADQDLADALRVRLERRLPAAWGGHRVRIAMRRPQVVDLIPPSDPKRRHRGCRR
jgi:hypothetical protein